MGVLSQGPVAALASGWAGLPEKPDWHFVRQPETGLIMVRGSIGGGGAPFNFGEATVTRCVVALDSGEIGQAIVLGRDKEHATLAACFDALWQRAETRAAVKTIAAALAAAQEAADVRVRAQTAATKVDFFTMMRGED